MRHCHITHFSPGNGPPLRQRKGAVLVAALVVLMVILLLSAGLVRGLTLRHRQTRWEQQRQQAAWFADSALQRAIVQLQMSGGYAGETWHTTVEVDGEEQSGRAEIRVQTPADNTFQRIIAIEAQWPDVPLDCVLEQRTFTIVLPSRGATS